MTKEQQKLIKETRKKVEFISSQIKEVIRENKTYDIKICKEIPELVLHITNNFEWEDTCFNPDSVGVIMYKGKKIKTSVLSDTFNGTNVCRLDGVDSIHSDYDESINEKHSSYILSLISNLEEEVDFCFNFCCDGTIDEPWWENFVKRVTEPDTREEKLKTIRAKLTEEEWDFLEI